MIKLIAVIIFGGMLSLAVISLTVYVLGYAFGLGLTQAI